MLTRFTQVLSIFTFWLAGTTSGLAQVDWEPKNTWLFVVGVLEFQNKEEYGSFPQEFRRDEQLVDLFKERGVPDDQIVFLKDKAATQEEIETAFKEFLAKTDENSLLVVYYAGHGTRDEENPSRVLLASYDADIGDAEGWPVNKLVGTIESTFEGSDAILLADCCHSGALASTVKRKGSEVNYACLGSSTLKESSTGNWTFTESILAALRGDPEADADRDGYVTLTEARQFADAEMTFAENQKISWLLTEGWSGPTTFSKAEEQPTDKRIGAHVTVAYGKKQYKGRVLEVNEPQFKIFYYGYQDNQSEWVDGDRITWQDDEKK